MAIDAYRVEPYGAQPVASKYDYIDKDSKLKMAENLKSVMVNAETDLAEIKEMYKPGTIAYTAGFQQVWQLDASGEWVAVGGE